LLNEEINQLRRDLDNQRRDIEKLRRKPSDVYRSTESLASASSFKLDENAKGKLNFTDLIDLHFVVTDILHTWVQTPQENGRKKAAWKKQLAILTKKNFALYNSDKDQQAAKSIDLT